MESVSLRLYSDAYPCHTDSIGTKAHIVLDGHLFSRILIFAARLIFHMYNNERTQDIWKIYR